MRWRIGLATILGVVAWASNAPAQSIELASIGSQYMPSADLRGVPGKVQVASYDVALNAPIPVAEKTFIIPGLGYHADSVSYSGTAPEFVQLRAFQSIEASALVVQMLPDSWSIAARLATGLAGDFQAVDAGLLRASAVATATHSFSKRFTLGGGAITSFSFGTFLPLPAVFVDWKPFDGFEVESFLPAFAKVHYTVLTRVRFGISGDFNGNEYAVRDPRVAGSDFDNLAYSVGTAGVTLGVRLFSSVWLNGLAGHSFFRRIDRRDASRDLVPGGRDDIPNVPVIRAALVWKIPERD